MKTNIRIVRALWLLFVVSMTGQYRLECEGANGEIATTVGSSSVATAAQKSGKGRYRKVVTLKKGAKKNGYTFQKRGSQYFVRCEGVEDPETGKRLEGSHEVEILSKVLNACTLDNKFWVFAGGLTDVQYTLTVTDCQPNIVRVYVNSKSDSE